VKITARFVLVVCLIVLLSGCAVGNRYQYHDTLADISATGITTIAVTVHDQRNYVITGDKGPEFVGLQRGGFGNPFDVNTDSGNALAYDMTQSLVNSLCRRGFKAMPVTVAISDDRQKVVNKLKEKGTERLLLLTLKEWKTDTLNNVALIYDVNATILDRDGKTVGEDAIKGRDNLGGSMLNPPAYARKAVPKAFKEKVEQLLNSKQIASGLN
jgi:hypothetical protein